MTIKTVSTSYFRTHLSQCVRETRTNGTIFIITKWGKPIARLRPLNENELDERPMEAEKNVRQNDRDS